MSIKKEILIVSSVALLTFVLRIVNLLAIPMFTDEAIYIRWSQIGLGDPAQRFISLTDGKQPLFTWLMYPMLKLFHEPLFAGRMVSVVAGTLAIVAIYLVARELFERKTAMYSMLLYLVSPFAMAYDRMALYDSLLNMIGLWALYLEILLVRKKRLDVALLLGIVVGLGMINKTSSQFFLYFLPVNLLLLKKQEIFSQKKLIALWIGLGTISAFIAEVMYNTLRVSPWFYIINQKNHVFILTFKEFFQSPFAVMISNLRGMIPMITGYLTAPIALLILAGVVWGVVYREKKIIYLFIWFLLPFLSLAAFGKIIFPRFMLFMTIPLLIIAAHMLSVLSRRLSRQIGIFVILLFIAYPTIQTGILATKPAYADIPSTDRNQFFDDWPSGYGVKETIDFLSEKAKEGKVVIGTEGTFGLFPAAYEIYLQSNPNVEIHGYWPLSAAKEPMIASAAKYPTYFVLKDTAQIPPDWPVTLVRAYPRGLGKTYLYFFKVHQK